jgi:4-amino-4-deoxy-L-arabinose transferase-like glycosyltransferase
VALGLALIGGTFAARCWLVARADAITSDETTHLVRSLHYWMTGDDLGMWELGAPRLPHLAYGLATYLALKPTGALPPSADEQELLALVVSGATRVLGPARALAIGWGLAMLGLVFWVVARRHGPWLGLVAAGLVSVTPECLAHSAIAGSDMPFTAAALLSLGLLARYVERPSPGRWLAVGLAIGLAWAMRHSGLMLIVLASGAHGIISLLRRDAEPWLDRVAGSLLATIGLTLVAFLVLWAGDGFEAPTLREVGERITTLAIPRRVGPIEVEGWRVPASALSVLKQVRHQAQGHEAYFCGAYGTKGWPTYFPVAFLLKTPVALLVLLVVAAVRVRPRGAWDAIALACLGLLWLMLVRNKVNIGLRYALLTYPLAATFVARLFAPAMLRDRVWGPITLAAAGWLLATSAACHPRYLSYFNEIGGGPRQGWLYLADSNVDWGQDFVALADALPELGLGEITYDVSTDRRLAVPGVLAVWNPPKSHQVPDETPPGRRLYDSAGGYIPVYTRHVAISATRLLGLYTQNDMSWLLGRRLVARVGDSIFVFDLDQPADGPLWGDAALRVPDLRHDRIF